MNATIQTLIITIESDEGVEYKGPLDIDDPDETGLFLHIDGANLKVIRVECPEPIEHGTVEWLINELGCYPPDADIRLPDGSIPDIAENTPMMITMDGNTS